MSAIPSQYLNNFESVKAKKRAFVDDYVNNHPHRLSSIRLTGSYNIQFDEREIATTQLTAYKTNEDVDYTPLSAWTRVYGEKLPVIGDIGQIGVAGGAGSPGENEFYVAQDLNYFWRFYLVAGSRPDPVKVGEFKTTLYEREVLTYDPITYSEWEEISADTQDIEENGYPTIITAAPFYNSTGGHPVSGGRGADNDENSAFLAYVISGSNVPSSGIYRLPWQDPWADESAMFTQAMADYLEAENAYSGGGWTGSTTVTLEFS